MEPTKDEYVAELKRFSTPEIAQLFKVSEAAVEGWKAGNPTGFPPAWEVVVQILKEKGTPIVPRPT
jgi:hypothetical protein